MEPSSNLLDVLLRLTQTLTEDLPLEEALQHVTDAMLEMIPTCRHVSVRLLDDSRQELLAGARSGEGASQKPVTFKRGEGLAGWVIEHGEEAFVEDVTQDERFVIKPGQGFDIRSIIAVPLWSAAHVVGVLAITSNEEEGFDEQALLLTQLLANCAAPAIGRARLKRLAITDHHTKAYNQRFLFPRLKDEIERSKTFLTSLTLLLMDLDYFKLVNDDHGHAAGDMVLKRFAEHVRVTVRRHDILVRRGGEEFVLIMPNTSLEDALAVAERVRETFAELDHEVKPGVVIRKTVSMGLATWDGTESAEALESRADQAMYVAKNSGRNQISIAE